MLCLPVVDDHRPATGSTHRRWSLAMVLLASAWSLVIALSWALAADAL